MTSLAGSCYSTIWHCLLAKIRCPEFDSGMPSSRGLPAFASLRPSSSLVYRDCIPLQDVRLWGSHTPKVEHFREPGGLGTLLTPEQAAAKAWKLTTNSKENKTSPTYGLSFSESFHPVHSMKSDPAEKKALCNHLIKESIIMQAGEGAELKGSLHPFGASYLFQCPI